MNMMTRMKLKLGAIGAFSLIVATAMVTASLHSHAQEGSHPRAASVAEIRKLFELATAPKPQRCRFEADIELITPPFTKTQIEAELAHIEEFMRNTGRLMHEQQDSEWRIAQSNAIVKAHSGKRMLHLREWYSGRYYRLDQNDEGMGVERFMQAHPNEYCESYVNIPGSPFSEYSSYQVNRNLRSAMLFKQEGPTQQHELWQAFQMHREVAGIIIVSLADLSAARKLDPRQMDFRKLELDTAKAQRLHEQTDARWRLEAFDETLDRTNVSRFTLRGGFAFPAEPGVPEGSSTLHIEVWIGEVSGRIACLQERMTNSLDNKSVRSKREQFDARGYPATWTVTTVRGDSSAETKRVVLKQAEMNATFADEEVFAPVFPPDYIVSDVSSGQSVLLQKPDPKAWVKGRAGTTNTPTR